MHESGDSIRWGTRSITSSLASKLDALPDQPGVYIFKDSGGRIVYIGKAKSLRSRVRSYFNTDDDGRYQYPRLIASIRDLEVILASSEVEALKLEAGLIRHHRPRYNVDLRDDKSFPYIKVTREPFPRVLLTRKPLEGHPGDFYGPYTDVRETRYLIRTLKGVLQIRDCALPLTPEKIKAGKFHLCLDYHIGRCGGPCEGRVDLERYSRGLERFIKFLRGRNEEMLAELETEMKSLASDLRFEEAASTRDRISAARRFTEKQPKVDPDPIDCDAVGMVREDNYAALAVLKVRSGRIVGQSPFHMERAQDLDDGNLIEAFLVRHYELADSIPDAVYLPLPPANVDALGIYFSQQAGRKVTLHIPQRGEKRHLVELALKNAEHLLLERRTMSEKRDFIPRAVTALQEHLHVDVPPLVIEAFDISHLSGTDTVASMVCFKDGKPFKSGYRMFKIKTVTGIDDFAAIGEAVGRRYTRLLKEIEEKSQPVEEIESNQAEENANPESEDSEDSDDDRISAEAGRLPDLILIDGGLGQLNRARSVLESLALNDLPVIGLAKRLEEIYIPGESEPLQLSKSSSALKLLQQIRDEAHRFAITRQRMLRGKRQVKSRLDDIEGIGPNRRVALLKQFGSLKRITEASIEQIASVPGISKPLAGKIKAVLTGREGA